MICHFAHHKYDGVDPMQQVLQSFAVKFRCFQPELHVYWSFKLIAWLIGSNKSSQKKINDFFWSLRVAKLNFSSPGDN